MNESLRHQFDVTSGIPGEALAGLIAAACAVLATTWVSWVSWSSLRDLREQTATVAEALHRISWSGIVFAVVIALLAFAE